MKAKIAVIGAGALGRGTIGPLLLRAGHQITFFDNDVTVLRKLRHPTQVILFGQEPKNYAYEAQARLIDEFVAREFNLVITCTRPIAPPAFWHKLAASEVPTVMLENSIATPGLAQNNLYLGVADILSHHTGVCYSEDAAANKGRICVDLRAREVLGQVPGFHYIAALDLRQLWVARFITHNTGHAVLAYIGAQHGYQTIARAADDAIVAAWARGAMLEAGWALDHNPDYCLSLNITSSPTLHDFWWHYYLTEITRYQNFSPDTIARVARDPQRKLAYSERLLGPARAFYEVEHKLPLSLIAGINAAIRYAGYDLTYALSRICELEKGSPLYLAIKECYEARSNTANGPARRFTGRVLLNV